MKVTKKAVQGKYQRIIELGYCQAVYLLWYKTRVAHTAGTYGWNADIFDIGGVAVVTGYRPFGDITPDYKLVEAYNDKARDIFNNAKLTYDERRAATNALLCEFVTLAREQGKKGKNNA